MTTAKNSPREITQRVSRARSDKHDRAPRAALLVAVAILSLGPGDGRVAALEEARAPLADGPYAIAIEPRRLPLAVGENEVRVLVREPATGRPIRNVDVLITVMPIGRHGLDRTFAAAAAGDGDAAYGATVDTPSRGEWQILVRASGASGIGSASLVARAEATSPLREVIKVFLPPLTLTLLAFGVGRRGVHMRRQARGERRLALSRHVAGRTR